MAEIANRPRGTGGGISTALATLSYYPNHMVSQVAHGNGVNDLYEEDPNHMARPAKIQTANVLSGANWNSGSFEYDGAGNIKALRGMSEPIGRPAATGQLYGYDPFGNLTSITQDGSVQTISTTSTTNRLALPSTYSDTGNLTAWGGYTYAWDGFNAMTGLTGNGLANAFTYDADGERLSVASGGTTTYSLRGLDGKVLRGYTYNGSTWSWSKDYAYRAGQLLAAIDASGTKHMSLDHLGSPRLITNGDRSVATYHAYWAYGLDLGTDLDAVRMKFTGHERDNQGTAGMLDYMHARYYSPVTGKFLAVDSGDTKTQDPQTWNRYVYARGNPIAFCDRDGRQLEEALGATAAMAPLIPLAIALEAPSPVPGMTNAQYLGHSLSDLGTSLSRQIPQTRRLPPSQTYVENSRSTNRASSRSSSGPSGGNGNGKWPQAGLGVATLAVKALQIVPGGQKVVDFAIAEVAATQALWSLIKTGFDTVMVPSGGIATSDPSRPAEVGYDDWLKEHPDQERLLGSTHYYFHTDADKLQPSAGGFQP
jgi:RHS repeat-associated protein